MVKKDELDSTIESLRGEKLCNTSLTWRKYKFKKELKQSRPNLKVSI